MPTRCQPCLGADIKAAILRDFAALGVVLDQVPDCPAPRQIEMCPRKKRAAGPYALFVKQCLPTKSGSAPEKMAACAADWRARKGAA